MRTKWTDLLDRVKPPQSCVIARNSCVMQKIESTIINLYHTNLWCLCNHANQADTAVGLITDEDTLKSFLIRLSKHFVSLCAVLILGVEILFIVGIKEQNCFLGKSLTLLKVR